MSTENIDVTAHDFPEGITTTDEKINFIRNEIHRFENEASNVHSLTLQTENRELHLGADAIVENLKVVLRKLEEQQ